MKSDINNDGTEVNFRRLIQYNKLQGWDEMGYLVSQTRMKPTAYV